jgi:hypothetical protein
MIKISDTDLRVEQIKRELTLISARHNGYRSTEVIVDAAKNENSPLHNEFEWDDTEAAHKFRLAQAGALVRRVKFTLIRENEEDKKINITVQRAYQSRESARDKANPDHGYEPIEVIMRNETKRHELVSQVLKELQAYRKRYASFMELKDVWNAIDDTAVELEVIDSTSTRHGAAGKQLHAT